MWWTCLILKQLPAARLCAPSPDDWVPCKGLAPRGSDSGGQALTGGTPPEIVNKIIENKQDRQKPENETHSEASLFKCDDKKWAF